MIEKMKLKDLLLNIISFQDPATPMMEGILDLHHNIFLFLLLSLCYSGIPLLIKLIGLSYIILNKIFLNFKRTCNNIYQTSFNGSFFFSVSDVGGFLDINKKYIIFIGFFIFVLLFLVHRANNMQNLFLDIKDFFRSYKANFSKFDCTAFLDLYTVLNVFTAILFLVSLKMGHPFHDNYFLLLFLIFTILNIAYHIIVLGFEFYFTVRVYSVFIPIILVIFGIVYAMLFNYFIKIYFIANGWAYFISGLIAMLYLRIILSNKLVSIYKTADFQSFYKLSFFFIYFFVRTIFDRLVIIGIVFTLVFPVLFVIFSPLYALVIRNIFERRKLSKNQLVIGFSMIYLKYMGSLYAIYLRIKKAESSWQGFYIYNGLIILILFWSACWLEPYVSTALFLGYFSFNMLINVNATTILSSPDILEAITTQMISETAVPVVKQTINDALPATSAALSSGHIVVGSPGGKTGVPTSMIPEELKRSGQDGGGNDGGSGKSGPNSSSFNFPFTGSGMAAVGIPSGAILQNELNRQQQAVNDASQTVTTAKNHITKMEGKRYELNEKKAELNGTRDDLLAQRRDLLATKEHPVRKKKIADINKKIEVIDDRDKKIDEYDIKVGNNIQENRGVVKSVEEQYPGLFDKDKTPIFSLVIYPDVHQKKFGSDIKSTGEKAHADNNPAGDI